MCKVNLATGMVANSKQLGHRMWHGLKAWIWRHRRKMVVIAIFVLVVGISIQIGLHVKHMREDQYTDERQAELMQQMQVSGFFDRWVTTTTLSVEEQQLIALKTAADAFAQGYPWPEPEAWKDIKKTKVGTFVGYIYTDAISLHAEKKEVVHQRAFFQGGEVDSRPGVLESFLREGPGHWPATPWPGQGGNCVIQGHRTTNSGPFRWLDELERGDKIVLIMDYAIVTYEVIGQEGSQGWFAVLERDAWLAAHRVDGQGEMLTLMACHTPKSSKYRIIVHAKMVGFELVEQNWDMQTGEGG